MTHHIWTKGQRVQLSPHFTSTEFDCPCTYPTCVEQKVSVDLLAKLELVRNECGFPISIVRGGGFRCSEYQNELRRRGYETAQTLSQHELGNAADPRGRDTKRLQEVCQKHFLAVGLGRTKTHVDTRGGRVRRWTYR